MCRGHNASAWKEAGEETLQLSLPRRAHCVRWAPVTGSQLACHLPARRGRARRPSAEPARLGPASLGSGCSGSSRPGRAVTAPSCWWRSRCLPSDKKCGFVFSFLEKMSGPGTVSARQEEPGTADRPPSAHPSHQVPLPGEPHLLSAGLGARGLGTVGVLPASGG